MTDKSRVSNVETQRIDIYIPPKKIDPEDSNPAPTIEITHLWHIGKMKEFEISLDKKVPKELSILPQIKDDNLSTPQTREESKIYVEVGKMPTHATLEQVKSLNTKTVFVDELTDTKINKLSNEDIVMLRKEK